MLETYPGASCIILSKGLPWGAAAAAAAEIVGPGGRSTPIATAVDFQMGGS